MREAHAIGAGQSEFDSFPDGTYRALFETTFEPGGRGNRAGTGVSTVMVEVGGRVTPSFDGSTPRRRSPATGSRPSPRHCVGRQCRLPREGM